MTVRESQKKEAESRFRIPESTEFNSFKTLDETLCRVLREHALAVEGLTENQMASALRQAIECGDFVRQIRFPEGAQDVVYIPNARIQELEAKYIELEKLVNDYMVAKQDREDFEIPFANLREWWKQHDIR